MVSRVTADNQNRKLLFNDYELSYSDFPKPSQPYNKFEVEDLINEFVKTNWSRFLSIKISALREDGEPVEVYMQWL